MNLAVNCCRKIKGVAATGGSWKELERGRPAEEEGVGDEERARPGEPPPAPIELEAEKVETCERRGEEEGEVLLVGRRGAVAEEEAEA